MRISLSILILLLSIEGICQDQRNQSEAARIAEDLVATQEEDADYETLYENLLQMLSSPLNLNSATVEDLRSLHLLRENQIDELLDHRAKTGNFISIYELQSLKTFDESTVQKLMSVAIVADPSTSINRSLLHKILKERNSYLITRVERTLGNKAGEASATDSLNKFLGSPIKTYTRFRSSRPKDYSFGFTAERDAGEKFTWQPSNNQYGFDFLSYHLQLQKKGRIKNLIVGDFQSQFGQGLVLGGGFGLGKGGEVVTTSRKTNTGLIPYSSINETGFYRGAALTYTLTKYLNATLLYSNIKRDATQNEDQNNAISSFLYTGFHRTENELNKRKQVGERNCGLILNYDRNNFDGGLIFHRIDFSDRILKKPSPYNQFAFSGDQNTTLSGFLNYRYQNINFFSELAKNVNGGNAIILGILASLHQRVDFSALFRKYDKNYYSFYSNAFSENSQPQNETGFYWGMKYQITRKYTASLYTDIFKFPWLGFRRYQPSTGFEWLIRFNYQPSRKTIVTLQLREENKARNTPANGFLYEVVEGRKRNFWLKLICSPHPSITLKTQLQLNSYTISGSMTQGFALLQDASYTIGKFQLTGRYAIFDSRNFDNRTYVYENDAYMVFSIPAYYGTGIRNYVLLEYKITQAISAWLRYACTRYTDRNEIGSGVDMIAGNMRKDVKFQVLIKF